MKYKIILISVLILGLMLVDSGFSQEETIKLGTIDLKLDMKKVEVFQKLRLSGHYELKQKGIGGCPDGWEVKSSYGFPHQKDIGTLCFIDDKLVAAIRNWGESQGKEAFEMTRVLFSIISNLEKEGDVFAKLSTESNYLPDTTMYILHIYIGRRQISIGCLDDHTQKRQQLSISIFEALMNKEALKRNDAAGK